MELSETARWLQQALLDLCSNSSSGLQLEPEVVASLVSYCELASPVDASEYIRTIVGDKRSQDVVEEYLRRRGGDSDKAESFEEAVPTKRGVDDFYAVSSKRGSKNGSRQRSVGSEGQVSGKDRGPSVVSGVASFIKTGVAKTKAVTSKAKKGGKSVSLSEAADGSVVFRGGQPCNCQASRHGLVNNCLSCGKIVCEQEGEGPCNYCGALVLREGSEYAGLEGVISVASTDSEAAAIKFKNRLVEYGRNSAPRTAVIDDQMDYYQMQGDAWISAKEKDELRKKEEEKDALEEERRKRVVVTVDLLGRKVVLAASEDGKQSGERSVSILTGEAGGAEGRNSIRIRPNPSLKEQPTFVGTKSQQGRRPNTSVSVPNTGRVQHEDPFLNSVFSLHEKDATVKVVEGNWWNQNRNAVDYPLRPPKVSERCERRGDEDEACNMERCSMERLETRNGEATASVSGAIENKNPNKTSVAKDADGRRHHHRSKSSVDNSASGPTFDICPPLFEASDGRGLPRKLAASLLDVKRAERQESLSRSIPQVESVHHLSPGVAFLRSWLTIGEQVEIVNECRKLGLGPGGFYTPSYADGKSLHLRMMCLGKHWEPNTNAYEVRRSYHDNAEAPPIPAIFLKLVDKALSAAKAKNQEVGGKKRAKDQDTTFPRMVPNICVVNFYEQTGNLGMHQDKAESPETLKRGSPVVSFSIGDSAEFCFGIDRDLENAEKVILESGDVFIFGGPARMMFHSITRVHPKTAPAALVEKANLRPGRLNLTFREF